MRDNDADEGFTLIELLIVVIVLGILAAIVIFAVSTTRGSAVSATCRTDVRAIMRAAEMVRVVSGSYPADEPAFVPNPLKEWPGGAVTTTNGTTSTSDDFAFTFSGGGASYALGVYGKSLVRVVLTQTASAGDVSTACTPS